MRQVLRIRHGSALMALTLMACAGEVSTRPEAGGAGAGQRGAAGSGGRGGATEAGGRGGVDPGTVTMRRLNQTELRHTIRDLLGIDRDVTVGFPPENIANGFDNGADVLGFSSTHAELWRRMAATVATEALGTAASPGPARARLLTCDPAKSGDACVRDVVTKFARRAWRRPPTADAVDRLVALAARARTAGGDADAALAQALTSILLSPHFVFRIELDPDANAARPRSLTGFELATRLSYFLWASTPDDALLARAERNDLMSDGAIVDEVDRLLGDARASSLTADFAGQWLQTRVMTSHTADPKLFPAWNAEVGTSMRSEAEAFFTDLWQHDRPVQQLLTSDRSFMDDRLIAYYGVVGAPAGSGLRPVTLPPERRAGWLGLGLFQTVTSLPTRTSIVKRGVWVLAQLMCAAPPPPADGAAVFDPSKDPVDAPLRERMAVHRAAPQCAVCHNLIDPVGLGLEKFDAVGRTRTTDQGRPIDDSGTLPGGKSFVGASALAQNLAADERLVGCIAKQLMTYAIGRGMRDEDEPALADVVARARGDGSSFRSLVRAIALAPPFRMRRPQGAQP